MTDRRPIISSIEGVRIALLMFAASFVFLAGGGCRRGGEPAATTAAASSTGDAAGRLRQVIDRYQAAAHYRDRGRLRLEYQLQGRPVVDESEVAVAFERPNRLRVSVERGINRLTVIGDGTNLWCRVSDPVSDDLRGQVVQRPAPERLTVAEVYSVTDMLDPSQPHQMRSVLMGLPLNLYTSQLGLVLIDSGVLDLVKQSADTRWLEPGSIDAIVCDRAQLAGSNGNYVLWIDRESGWVRRIEYPTAELFEGVAAEQRPKDVKLTLDLDDIAFDPIDAQQFNFTLPDGSRQVQYFVLPPSPLPSELFGKKIPAMSFINLAGQEEASETWSGQIQVLLWFDRHAPSQINVSRLERSFRQYAQHLDRVTFRLICAEPPSALSNEELRRLMDQWQASIPVLRDVHAAGRDALNIDQAPTVAVLDTGGRLHLFEVGANDQVDQAIQLVLGRLLAGEDVAADVLRNSELAEERFEHQLQLAALQPVTARDVPDDSLAEKADFTKLRAELAWRNEELDAPGNLLVIASRDSKPHRLLALNAMQEVIELDVDGRVTARHRLDLPEAAFVGQLGHAVDGEGNDYYWGFSQLGRQVYVFDGQFRNRLTYPPTDVQHQGVMDAELVDLDADGRLELYVGFAGPAGCHRIELDGERRWTNRSLPTIVSLASRQISGFAQLFATSETGWLQPIELDGRSGPPMTIEGRAIHQIESSGGRRPRPSHFLGMAYSIEGRWIALGLNASLQEQWAYGLPAGVFRHQVQSPRWAPLGPADRGGWLLAAPDGTVHVVRDDGRFFDHMATGADVLGIAGHALDDKGRLYVTTPRAISAYNLIFPREAGGAESASR